MVRGGWRWPALLCAAAVGCGPTAPAPDANAASKVVQTYFEAIVHRDWPAAYDAMHPDTRDRVTRDQFARLAEAYRRNLGFEPTGVRVSWCEEQDGRAVAHVVLTGRTHHQKPQYKDGLMLRPTDGGWRVVLPDNFGRKSP